MDEVGQDQPRLFYALREQRAATASLTSDARLLQEHRSFTSLQALDFEQEHDVLLWWFLCAATQPQ